MGPSAPMSLPPISAHEDRPLKPSISTDAAGDGLLRHGSHWSRSSQRRLSGSDSSSSSRSLSESRMHRCTGCPVGDFGTLGCSRRGCTCAVQASPPSDSKEWSGSGSGWWLAGLEALGGSWCSWQNGSMFKNILSTWTYQLRDRCGQPYKRFDEVAFDAFKVIVGHKI